MADITNTGNIPTGKRAAIKTVVEEIGPTVVPKKYPTNPDGTPKDTLTAAEGNAMFEQITREFWRQQLAAHEANAAADAARDAALEANAGDPFA